MTATAAAYSALRERAIRDAESGTVVCPACDGKGTHTKVISSTWTNGRPSGETMQIDTCAICDGRKRVATFIAEGETDRAREAAIECKRLEALGLLGTEHRERLREIETDLARLISERSPAAVDRIERERGLTKDMRKSA